MELIYLLNVIALLAGGILAASGLIVARKPNAKELIDKLVPYQVIIGVAMLGLGLIGLLWWLAHGLFTLVSHGSLFGITVAAMTLTSIVLGFLFGMPQIAKWMAGNPAARDKAVQLSRSVAPYQGMLGIIGLVAALLALLYRLHILSVV
ncbi:MAG TPA: hypothetical protein VGD37_00815 [Kofleriaceae bacterium]|jgi:hypothetical protein